MFMQYLYRVWHVGLIEIQMKSKWFEVVCYAFIIECVVFNLVTLSFKWKPDCNDVRIKYKAILEHVTCERQLTKDE